MKSIIAGLIVPCAILASCSTHYYEINGQEVTLYLEKPQAKDVSLFCSMDDFQRTKVEKQNGVWELTLPAHKAFKYFYRVDGEIFLPSCALKEKDDFGTENCIFEPQK